MEEAQKSIGEKLKAIKLQQMANQAKGGDDNHTHDPSEFSFIKTTKLQNVHSGAYFYSGNRLRFEQKPSDKQGGAVIYKTNTQVYQTAEYVDMMCSWLSTKYLICDSFSSQGTKCCAIATSWRQGQGHSPAMALSRLYGPSRALSSTTTWPGHTSSKFTWWMRSSYSRVWTRSAFAQSSSI